MTDCGLCQSDPLGGACDVPLHDERIEDNEQVEIDSR
jgi:hypothetical protein